MEDMRKCKHCGKPLEVRRRTGSYVRVRVPRPDAVYCSTRCRVAAHRAKRGTTRPKAVTAVTPNPALIKELDPLLEKLALEGQKNMATMSPPTVAYLALMIEEVLVRYGVMPESKRTRAAEDRRERAKRKALGLNSNSRKEQEAVTPVTSGKPITVAEAFLKERIALIIKKCGDGKSRSLAQIAARQSAARAGCTPFSQTSRYSNGQPRGIK